VIGMLYVTPPGTAAEHDFYRAIRDPNVVGASGMSTNEAKRIVSQFERGRRSNAFLSLKGHAAGIRDFTKAEMLRGLFRLYGDAFEAEIEARAAFGVEAARTGNWFLEANLVIARLDKLSRNEEVQQKLQAPDCRWDLVVCDEAHKMAATFFGGEIKYTKRYRLGQLLSMLTRH
jgi:hypothetical protein